MAETAAPDTPSADYKAMELHWDKVDAIIGGLETMKAAKDKFLPKYPDEAQAEFDYRLSVGKMTNVYVDVVDSLVHRLFREEISLKDGADQTMKDLAENIDGQGNSLHVFAANMGWSGINYAMDWLLVDYTNVTPGRTVAEEKASGARPYWVHIPARNMLAVYSVVVKGQEIICHARIKECVRVRQGFDEKTVTRIRVLNREPVYGNASNPQEVTALQPATWELWQEGEAAGTDLRTRSSTWQKVGEGPITIGEIPLTPFITGRRKVGSWQVRPALKDAVDKQIELYQRETNLWHAEELTASPMLAGNGVSPALGGDGNPLPIRVRPAAVLYAPMAMSQDGGGSHGEWKWLNTDSTGLTYLKDQKESCEKAIRELGKQPLTAQSGNVTVVTSAFAAQKSISACEAWGLNLKDTLENGFRFTAKWLNQAKEPEVQMPLDGLTLDLEGDTAFDDLLKMREKGDLSQETLWSEAKRRGRLSPEFDPAKERERIIEEMPEGDDLEEDPEASPPPAA